MKKRILSLLLVLVLLVTVSVFAVEATEVPDETEATEPAVVKITYEQAVETAGGETGTLHFWCDHCKDNVDWVKATASNASNRGKYLNFNSSQHAYVNSTGLTVQGYAAIGSDKCLYLKGTVTTNGPGGTDKNRADTFRFNSTNGADIDLAVMGTGSIVSTSTYPVFNYTTNPGVSKLHLYGVTIDASGTSCYGSIVRVGATATNAEINIHGATLIGSPSVTAGNGGAVYSSGDIKGTANFWMTSGTIKGGAISGADRYGGNVYLGTDSTFTMDGGTIEGGRISATGEAVGGNVYLGSGATVTINGGTIKDGYVESSGNSTTAGGNIGTSSGATFTMNGGEILDGQVHGNGTGSSTNGYGGNIRINSSSTKPSTVTLAGGKISGGKAYAYYTARGGNVVLDTSVNATITGDVEILNGHSRGTNTAEGRGGKGGNIYLISGALTVESGLIKGGTCARLKTDGTTTSTDTGCRGGNLYTDNATVNLTGGTFYNGNGSAQAWMGGNIYSVESTLTVNGATIIGGRATRGGCIGLAAGTLNIQSGIIRGGTATNTGGCIHSECTVNMTGGTITDRLESDGLSKEGGATSNGGSIYVGGKTFTLDGAEAVIEGQSANYGGGISIGQGGLDDEKYGTFILKNGTVNGGKATKQGGAIQVRDGGKLTLAGGTVIPGTAGTNGEAVVVNNGGQFTLADGFTGTLEVVIDGAKDTVFEGNKIVSTKAVSNGYVNGGNVVVLVSGVQYPIVGEGTDLVFAPVAIYNGNDVVSAPASAQEAVEAVADGQYVKLFHSGAELNLTKATTVDFNGQAAIVNGAEYLTAMDAATNDYDDADAAKVTLNGTVNVNNVVNLIINGVSGQRKYVALQNTDGTYSFHRYYITMRNVGLRVTEDKNAPDLIFSATFRGTQAVADAVSSFGIDMKGEGAESAKTVNYMDHGMTFEAGKTINGKNINLTYKNDATVTSYGDKNVTATAFIQLGDAIRLEVSEPTTTSLKAQVEYFAANYANQSAAGKEIIDTMLANNVDLFNTLGWTVTKQEAAA